MIRYDHNHTIQHSMFRSANNFEILGSHLPFLDSERSDECIDFTMIITIRNNAPISNYGGGFQCKSEYPWCIIEFSKKLRTNH
ncbi:Uncharacterized protein FWK35_00033906 [Aphis craccivora]|uniref:Uncharacterized protein n=1 Tax=Aphis craccivora TaxID=307492 RepID=A0A6G0YH16_APHCR|nr:Uncharacterized protein FWK35_00033906 [Aphis craccivora]